MAVPSVVLVDWSREPVGQARLVEVARALQTQVDRDFGTVWGVEARVEAAAVAPPGAWIIAIVEDPGARLGVHHDGAGNPRAAVRAGDDWTLAVSHALLEMVANPDGTRFMEGPDITRRSSARHVRYLVEVCDPCQVFHYEIDGVRVSDFVTPDYYRRGVAPGTALDFLRHVRRPLDVPRGGYLTWRDPEDGRWHQRRPDLTITISRTLADANRDPRADRDDAFPEDGDRHDIAGITSAYAPGRSRGPRRGRRP